MGGGGASPRRMLYERHFSVIFTWDDAPLGAPAIVRYQPPPPPASTPYRKGDVSVQIAIVVFELDFILERVLMELASVFSFFFLCLLCLLSISPAPLWVLLFLFSFYLFYFILHFFFFCCRCFCCCCCCWLSIYFAIFVWLLPKRRKKLLVFLPLFGTWKLPLLTSWVLLESRVRTAHTPTHAHTHEHMCGLRGGPGQFRREPHTQWISISYVLFCAYAGVLRSRVEEGERRRVEQ